jgi:hypothetical protein
MQDNGNPRGADRNVIKNCKSVNFTQIKPVGISKIILPAGSARFLKTKSR